MGLRAPSAPQMPQQPKAPLPEFAVQRKKVEQRINADAQGQQDAVNRRLAAQGMLNSGAAIKQQGLIANQATQNREDALAGVDAAENSELARRQEVQDNRDFSANESRLGRDFAANESKLGRDLQGSQFDRSFAQSGSQFDRSFAQAGDQFNKNFGLQKDQFREDKANTAFNRGIATKDLSDEEKTYLNDYTKGYGLNKIKVAAPPPQQQLGYGLEGFGGGLDQFGRRMKKGIRGY